MAHALGSVPHEQTHWHAPPAATRPGPRPARMFESGRGGFGLF